MVWGKLFSFQKPFKKYLTFVPSKTVEMFHRTYKFDAILGGAEEVLMDLGVRQAVVKMPMSML